MNEGGLLSMLNVTVLSPIALILFILAMGSMLARWDTPKFSPGISWVLFLSLAVGFLLRRFSLVNDEYIQSLCSVAKALSPLGTALFVSVIGFTSGHEARRTAKGGSIAFFIGSAMSFFGILLAYALAFLDASLSRSSMLGILCGALTSTPGLASVCELPAVGTDEAVLAYSCAYLPGVAIAVLGSRYASRRQASQSMPPPKENNAEKVHFLETFTLLFLGAAIGSLIGGIKLPLLHISLGSTCGILLTSLAVGIFTKQTDKEHSTDALTVLRNLGLSLFFVGTGLSTGLQIDALYWRALLYGGLLAFLTAGAGYAIVRFLKRMSLLHGGCILAGGMTSSPALGEVLRQDSNIPIEQFSFSYLGSLLTLSTVIPLLP